MIAFSFLALGSLDSEEKRRETRQAVSAAEPVADLTAAQLLAEYDENSVAADRKYEGKVVRVSGVLQNIGEDLLGKLYITLDTGNPISSVQCFLDDAYVDQVAELKKGQGVAVKGVCKGKTINILLEDCVPAGDE